MQKCVECGKKVVPLLVTSVVGEWDADDEQVDEMGEEYVHLKSDWISTPKGVCVGWHICPDCKAGIGKPWIEQA
jgi:hypothetical protein